jgi:hypothetical protein
MQVTKLPTLPLRTVILSLTLFNRQVFHLCNLSLECYMCCSSHRIRLITVMSSEMCKLYGFAIRMLPHRVQSTSWVAQWIEWMAESFKKRILRPAWEASFEFWAMFRLVPAGVGYLWIYLWGLSQGTPSKHPCDAMLTNITFYRNVHELKINL